MGKDMDRGDFYNTYNFMSITSSMGFIGYAGYLCGEREKEVLHTFYPRYTIYLI